ncbi:hypothetical protein QYQ98_08970 [Corynebacterium sp. P3-F1]|uniref:hypothetical protein n=1 Tax=Corynebacterium sp. P3-F1 TaxID=3059080 RepID=UPI00265D3145|nr:hypothetical protein [Corynebacterium sp. P3-F1]WKK61138.1 hypothetical protein QYQ98_08970 [Corynebacterium sp. P3-F1]
MAPRERRRTKRISDADYDRKADRPHTGRSAGDGERFVELDDALTDDTPLDYAAEKPPHYGD